MQVEGFTLPRVVSADLIREARLRAGLTQAELAEVAAALDAVLMRYIDQRPIDDLASRPAGSVPVTFTLFAVPGGPPPGPGTATEA